ncbi:MAG: BCCT family transporter [Saprospiraceae bacterium]|nr:BCCT family transporter [Lewinella sp.]
MSANHSSFRLIGALLVCLIFVIPGLLWPTEVFELTGQITTKLLSVFHGFYLWLGLILVLFCLVLAVSPWGKIRLGNADERPAFGFWSWLAMLYSAGMGAGLLQRAVQEPAYYYLYPPVTDVVEPAERQLLSLQYAHFHWGFTAWGFYASFGLIAAYFLFRKNKAALPSQLISNAGVTRKINWYGGLDLLAILATVFGLVASVGLGSGQIAEGLGQWLGIRLPVWGIMLVGLGLGIAAFISAWSGLEKGIKLISQINMGGAVLLLLFFLFHNSFIELFVNFGKSIWYYIRDFVPMSLAWGAYGKNPAFTADWTIFYWAFWLAWAPFTGLFIARISRGRTIRSFVLGVLIVPSLGTFLWFSVFGTLTFDLISTLPEAHHADLTDIFKATYLFYTQFPLSNFNNLLTIFLLSTFLITSLDSAIYVVSMMTGGGKQVPGWQHKVSWGVTLPLVTAVAIWVGGDALLRSMSNLLIIVALPFGFILLLMIVFFLKTLYKDEYGER